MPLIQTPLAQVLNPVKQGATPIPGLFAGINAGLNQKSNRELAKSKLDLQKGNQDIARGNQKISEGNLAINREKQNNSNDLAHANLSEKAKMDRLKSLALGASEVIEAIESKDSEKVNKILNLRREDL